MPRPGVQPAKQRAGAPAAPTAQVPELHIDLYDDITRWSVRDIVSMLRANPSANVTLRINCPGGDVLEGFALANVLRSHQGKKVAIVEGACSSAATFALCACGEVRMYPESFLMVHGPSADTFGSAEDLEQHAELLRKMTGLMTAMIERKSGKDLETVAAWMTKDSWMTPAEALANGLCDVILDATPTASARARTARYVARLKRAPKSTTTSPPARNAMDENETESTLPADVAAKLADFGLSEGETSPAAVKAALMSYLSETEDGPEDRKAMMDACKAVAGDAKAKDGEEDEDGTEDETDSNGKAAAKGGAPASSKLVDSLTGKVAKLGKKLASYEAKEKKRTEDDFFAKALLHTTREDAKEYLDHCGGDHGKALKLVQKLPKKNSPLGRWFADGSPIGGGRARGAGDSVEAHKQVSVGGRAMYIGGYGFAAMAKKIAADKKISLGEAQIVLAKERPELLRDEA